MRSNLRKNAMRFCEDCIAFFARLKKKKTYLDFQSLTKQKAMLALHHWEVSSVDTNDSLIHTFLSNVFRTDTSHPLYNRKPQKIRSDDTGNGSCEKHTLPKPRFPNGY